MSVHPDEMRRWEKRKFRAYPGVVDKVLLTGLKLFDAPDTRDNDHNYILTSRVRTGTGDLLLGLQVYAPPHL